MTRWIALAVIVGLAAPASTPGPCAAIAERKARCDREARYPQSAGIRHDHLLHSLDQKIRSSLTAGFGGARNVAPRLRNLSRALCIRVRGAFIHSLFSLKAPELGPHPCVVTPLAPSSLARASSSPPGLF